jgi:DNA-damage-inducible protein D
MSTEKPKKLCGSNFEQVIKKAKTACFNSGHRIEDHFVDIIEMIDA